MKDSGGYFAPPQANRIPMLHVMGVDHEEDRRMMTMDVWASLPLLGSSHVRENTDREGTWGLSLKIIVIIINDLQMLFLIVVQAINYDSQRALQWERERRRERTWTRRRTTRRMKKEDEEEDACVERKMLHWLIHLINHQLNNHFPFCFWWWVLSHHELIISQI